ncbi:MAG: hypothetical protein L3K07_01760 [Thermoplasmata archaeon]|nr:hypothetical protein [Thermoplasmata archaeon]
MPGECAICENLLEPEAPHCGSCGFPVALTSAAVIALGRDEPPEESEASSALGATPPHVEAPVPPERASLERFAESLRGWVEILKQLGTEARAQVGEVRQAALLDAEGRSGEALQLIRNAASSAADQAEELFTRRLLELEERTQGLSAQGLDAETPETFVRLRAEFDDGRTREAVLTLRSEDARLQELESSWRELKSLLLQIDELRGSALSIGEESARIDAELTQVRELLARSRIGANEIQEAHAVAARLLLFFQEALPAQLQEQLDRRADELARFGVDHPPSQKARQLHAESSRHLRHGRLAESALRLTELKRAIAELGSPESKKTGRRTTAPDEQQLASLLQKARHLASRVRHLPPGSPVAEEAATEIRQATESLRDRRLDDAEQALTRLMHSIELFEAKKGA